MLVLARKLNETIKISGGITVKVLSIGQGQVRLGVEAPSNVACHRGEVWTAIEAEGRDPEAHLRQRGGR